MIVQKFNSLDQIDTEFIPSLEELLCESIPSFQYLKNIESLAPKETFFAYYLFFGHTTNAPIGFAQATIVTEFEKPLSLFEKFKGTSHLLAKKGKAITWSIPCNNSCGYVFSPHFKESGYKKLQSLVGEYFGRGDIREQKVLSSQENHFTFSNNSKTQTTEQPFMLLKNKTSYQDFLNSLQGDVSELIQRSWRITQKELGLSIGDYSSFKEAFQYKSRGANQYKELKKRDDIKAVCVEGATYLTLENSEQICALIVFIKGVNTHSYYKSFVFDNNIAEVIPHQMAIMKLYETPDCDRLHSLGHKDNINHFKDLGFIFKSLTSQTLKSL